LTDGNINFEEDDDDMGAKWLEYYRRARESSEKSSSFGSQHGSSPAFGGAKSDDAENIGPIEEDKADKTPQGQLNRAVEQVHGDIEHLSDHLQKVMLHANVGSCGPDTDRTGLAHELREAREQIYKQGDVIDQGGCPGSRRN
jgi:hypothetical protein